MHCYERTYPTINGQVFGTPTLPPVGCKWRVCWLVRFAATPGQKVYTKPTAPIHIVQGTAGAFIEETYASTCVFACRAMIVFGAVQVGDPAARLVCVAAAEVRVRPHDGAHRAGQQHARFRVQDWCAAISARLTC